MRKLEEYLGKLFLLALAMPAQVVVNSTPVSDDYNDHIIVRFMAKNADATSGWKRCKGVMLGGKYLFTADHCFDTDFLKDVKFGKGLTI